MSDVVKCFPIVLLYCGDASYCEDFINDVKEQTDIDVQQREIESVFIVTDMLVHKDWTADLFVEDLDDPLNDPYSSQSPSFQTRSKAFLKSMILWNVCILRLHVIDNNYNVLSSDSAPDCSPANCSLASEF